MIALPLKIKSSPAPSQQSLSSHPNPDDAGVFEWRQLTAYNMGLTCIVAGLIAWLIHPYVLNTGLIMWVTALCGVSALRLLYTTSFNTTTLFQNHLHWYRPGFYTLAVVAGFAWASVLFLISPGEHLAIDSFLLISLFIVGVVSYGSYEKTPLAQLFLSTPIYFTVAIWASMASGFVHTAVAISMPVLFIANAYLVKLQINRNDQPQAEKLKYSLLQRDIALTKGSLNQEVAEKMALEIDLKRTQRLFLDGPAVAYRFQIKSKKREILILSGNVQQYGYRATGLEGEFWEDLVHPDDQEIISLDSLQASRHQEKNNLHREYRLKASDGRYHWIYDYIVPIENSDGVVEYLDGYFIDVTKQHSVGEALSKEKERAQVTLQSIGDAVITTDTNGLIQFCNNKAEVLTGWKANDANHVSIQDVLSIRWDEKSDWIANPLEFYYSYQDENSNERIIVENRSLDDEFGLVDLSISKITAKSGEIYGHVLVLRDVTEEEELLKEIEFQARHDDLTGIYNRWEFENRFQALVSATRDNSSAHILMYLDLDQFKLVNDTSGHHAGDELLRRLTGAFGACLDNNAILARLGGDEFGVLLENCDIEMGMKVAHDLRKSAEEFHFVWEDKSFSIGVSIGVVPITYPVDSIQSLMGFADVACYLAKENGRNNVRLHREGDEEQAKRQAEMNWATRIKSSVSANEFSLHYQDIVPVATAGVSGVRKIEILLRLLDKNGEYLSPNHFLPSAERYNLTPDLDRLVIDKAFKWYRDIGYSLNIMMNINLSGLSFCATGFLEYITEKFSEFGVPPGSVCFELTETAAIQHLPDAQHFMRSLRTLGCRFALDDFGTGLSSFAYLKDLPVDYLKIDGKFVKGISTDPVDRAMVSAINEVGHTMKIKTVAEYVENKSIMDELRALKVDFAQGYNIGKPASLNSLAASTNIH